MPLFLSFYFHFSCVFLSFYFILPSFPFITDSFNAFLFLLFYSSRFLSLFRFFSFHFLLCFLAFSLLFTSSFSCFLTSFSLPSFFPPFPFFVLFSYFAFYFYFISRFFFSLALSLFFSSPLFLLPLCLSTCTFLYFSILFFLRFSSTVTLLTIT